MPDVPDGDKPLDAREAAEFLGAHVETIRRLARRSEIPAYKIGKNWRFRKDALRHWAETQHLRVRKPTVLVVDDEPAVCNVVRRVLEDTGYRVTTVGSGAEALQVMRAGLPDLIILDLAMPGLDGVATLEGIREQAGGVPVLIHTGYPDTDLMAQALKLSPVMLLAKPAPRSKLLEAVRLALGKPHGAATHTKTTSGEE